MLETQNDIKNKPLKKENIKDKPFNINRKHIAAKYLSGKFIKDNNLKNPKKKISDHLIKIFLYFLNYKVSKYRPYKIIIQRKRRGFRIQSKLFNNSFNFSKKNNIKEYEVISVENFFIIILNILLSNLQAVKLLECIHHLLNVLF